MPGIAFNVSNEDVELASISISRPHTRKLYVITVYRPLNGNFKNFCEHLDQLLKLLPHPDKSDIIMGGDFNIDYSKIRKDTTKKLKHLSTKHSLVQYIQSPTRLMDSESIIDLKLSIYTQQTRHVLSHKINTCLTNVNVV